MLTNRMRTPQEVKEDILEYFYESKQWYMEHLLRDHATDILKSANMEADIDTCEVVDENGRTMPLDYFMEILYERIMQNVENVIEATDEKELIYKDE